MKALRRICFAELVSGSVIYVESLNDRHGLERRDFLAFCIARSSRHFGTEGVHRHAFVAQVQNEASGDTVGANPCSGKYRRWFTTWRLWWGKSNSRGELGQATRLDTNDAQYNRWRADTHSNAGMSVGRDVLSLTHININPGAAGRDLRICCRGIPGTR